MSTGASDLDAIRLSSSVTIAMYRKMEEEKDREGIADFLHERFTERYIAPLKSMKAAHGFCMMAVSCMLIEAIISFRSGWQRPTDQRDKPYREFFKHYREFGVGPHQADVLYDHVRSGILHLGETTGGWRIHRKGPLLDFADRTVNATLFAKAVVGSLDAYCAELKRATWQKPVWQNFRSRMGALIRNCRIAD